jgi:hypothetical protein
MRYLYWMILALAVATPALAQEQEDEIPPRQAVAFMRSVMDQVNPSLAIEDSHCVTALPWAIVQQAKANKVDWKQVFVLAWQESNFDCHAKSTKDKGGAFGPFQIRRVWESLIGDPRVHYYDPDLAVKRVMKVIRYYERSERNDELARRKFRYPLLCLYNTGERRDVNMKYCERVGKKMDLVLKSLKDYQAGRFIAIVD